MFHCLKTFLAATVLLVAATNLTAQESESRSSDEPPDAQVSASEGGSSVSHIEQKSGWYTSPDQGHQFAARGRNSRPHHRWMEIQQGSLFVRPVSSTIAYGRSSWERAEPPLTLHSRFSTG